MVPGSKTEAARRLKQRRNKSQYKCVLLGICYEQLLTAIGSGSSKSPEQPTEHQSAIQVSVERRLEQSSFCSLTHCVAPRQWPVRLWHLSALSRKQKNIQVRPSSWTLSEQGELHKPILCHRNYRGVPRGCDTGHQSTDHHLLHLCCWEIKMMGNWRSLLWWNLLAQEIKTCRYTVEKWGRGCQLPTLTRFSPLFAAISPQFCLK